MLRAGRPAERVHQRRPKIHTRFSTLKQELGKLYEIVNLNRDSKMEKAKIFNDRKVRAANFEKGTHVLLQILNRKIGENPSIAHKWKDHSKLWKKQTTSTIS